MSNRGKIHSGADQIDVGLHKASYRERYLGRDKDKIGEQLSLDKMSKLIFSERDRGYKNKLIARSVIDMIRNQHRPKKEIEKEKRNMNLLFGRWPGLKPQGLGLTMEVPDKQGGTKRISIGRNKINHYPMIDKVGQQAIASLMDRNTKMVSRDYCKTSVEYRQQAQEDLIVERISEVYFKPAIAQAQAQIQGIPPDQQQQAFSELMQQLVDPHIQSMVDKIEVPTEKLMQKLHDIAAMRTDIEYQYYKGANYVIGTGAEFYRRKFTLNEVKIENIPTFNAKWCLSEGSEFVEDGLWFGYDRYLTPVEIITKYHHVFKGKDFKELQSMMVDIPNHAFNSGGADYSLKLAPTTGEFSHREVMVPTTAPGNIDSFLQYTGYQVDESRDVIWSNGVFDDLSKAYTNKKGIKVSYATWRWLAKAKEVERKVSDGRGGFKIVVEMEDEHYRLNRSRGDLKIKDSARPMTYEGSCIGDFYFDVGPVMNQWEDATDHTNPKLGVYGCVYNTMDGAIKNLAFIDPMVPSQYRVNALSDALNDHVQNNLGSVMVVNEKSVMDAKGGMEGFFKMLHKFKFIINKDKDNNSIYSIDLGSNVDVRSHIELINFYRNEILEYGSTNATEYSGPGQYATNRNIDAALSGADRRKFRMFFMNRKTRQRVSNALMWGAFYAYQDNNALRECYLADDLNAHYDLNFDIIAGSPVMMEVEGDQRSANNLQTYVQYLFNYLSQGGSVDLLGDVLDARTMEEAKAIARKYEEQKQKRDEETANANRQAALEQSQQQQQLEIQLADRADARAQLNHDSRIKSAYLASLVQAHGADVNENGKADFVEKGDKDREAKILIEKMRNESAERIAEIKKN